MTTAGSREVIQPAETPAWAVEDPMVAEAEALTAAGTTSLQFARFRKDSKVRKRREVLCGLGRGTLS
jgi:hypothetical protein